MKNTYIFDFDGTLVDSMPVYATINHRFLNEKNITYGEDLIKIITPLGALGTAKYYRTVLGLQMTDEAIVEEIKAYTVEAYETSVFAKPQVLETLKALKAQGADLNVLTAATHKILDPCLKRLGMWELFSNVWSCDDFSLPKTDPTIYCQAADRLDISPSEIWFFDDNLQAARAAKEAGMLTCGVYDESSKELVPEMKAVCHRYIYSFQELL